MAPTKLLIDQIAAVFTIVILGVRAATQWQAVSGDYDLSSEKHQDARGCAPCPPEA